MERMTGPGGTAGGPGGGRRIVTILFCDVAGSTALAEQMDPEEWTDLMGEVFDRVIEPVYEFGGTVARLQGDAVLALFGAPIAHEDDPERAILAGLAMLDRVRDVADQLKTEWGLELKLRIGINTGLAVVGQVGSELKSEYTAMGDAVNVAARMEQTAEPGTIRVAEGTWRLTSTRFEFEDLGETEVRGKEQMLRSFRPLGVIAPTIAAARAEAPLVGREEEAELLRSVLDAVEAGSGRIVCITGEAGIGKTRLIEELHAWWRRRFPSAPWVGSRALSYQSHEPHLHTKALMSGALTAIGVTSLDEVLHDSELLAMQTLLEPDRHGASAEREDLPQLLADAASALVEFAAGSTPLAIVVEDLHWSDDASVRVLSSLLAVTDRAPVMFAFALRPERTSPGWELRNGAADTLPHRFLELNLTPLDRTRSRELIGRLVADEHLPEDLVDEIIARTDGNPLFVEEIIRSWSDRPAEPGSDGEFAVPDSIQALLLSRLDRLEPPIRDTVQVASVIGRNFAEGLVTYLRGDQTPGHLATLQRLDIVREVTRFPSTELSFRHALTHETVYGSILRKSRREYHRQVAEALMARDAEANTAGAAILAHHLDEAGDPRALEFALTAGDLAFGLSAHAEAAAHYGMAMRWARETEESEPFSHVASRLGRSLEVTARYHEALELYDEVIDRAARLKDDSLRLTGLLALARLRGYPNPTHDLETARSTASRALELAEVIGDRRSEAVALNILMMTSTFTGDPAGGIEHGIAALELARSLGGREEIAHTLNDLSWLYLTAGESAKALEVGAEAEELWRRLDNRPMLADSLAAQLYVSLLACDFDTTERRCRDLLAVGSDPQNDWALSMHAMIESWRLDAVGSHSLARSLRLQGMVHAERAGNLTGAVALLCDEALFNLSVGRIESAAEIAQRCIEQVEDRGFDGWRAWPRSVLVRSHIARGEWLPLPAAVKRDLLSGADKVRPLFGPGVVAAALGSIEAALVDGRLEDAQLAIDEVVAYQTDHGMSLWRPDVLQMQARLAFARGEHRLALDLVDRVIDTIAEFGSRRSLWQVFGTGARFTRESGDQARSDAFAARARLEARRMRSELPEDWRPDFDLFVDDVIAADSHPAA